jgi:CheY-like chemotaxis protein
LVDNLDKHWTLRLQGRADSAHIPAHPFWNAPMKSCLIVDDSSVVRKVARRILEDMDFIVDEAEDGQEAFDKCRQEMPDAILLDWQMPIMGGLEFLKLLRAYVGQVHGTSTAPRELSSRRFTIRLIPSGWSVPAEALRQ